MNTDDRPTRLVRSRDLVRGAVILSGCVGPGCNRGGTVHRTADEPFGSVVHELTLLDAEINDDRFTAIAMTEAGAQVALGQSESAIERVYADSMPLHVETL